MFRIISRPVSHRQNFERFSRDSNLLFAGDSAMLNVMPGKTPGQRQPNRHRRREARRRKSYPLRGVVGPGAMHRADRVGRFADRRGRSKGLPCEQCLRTFRSWTHRPCTLNWSPGCEWDPRRAAPGQRRRPPPGDRCTARFADTNCGSRATPPVESADAAGAKPAFPSQPGSAVPV